MRPNHAGNPVISGIFSDSGLAPTGLTSMRRSR